MDPEDPYSDPDHSKNLIISSFYLFRHILKISSKSVPKFLSYLVHKRTNKLTNPQPNPDENITSLAEVINIKIMSFNFLFIDCFKNTEVSMSNDITLYCTKFQELLDTGLLLLLKMYTICSF